MNYVTITLFYVTINNNNAIIKFRLRKNYVIILSLNKSKPFLARNISGG